MTAQDKVALISGVTGQGGVYLAELLLKKGYEVHGIKCRSSLFKTAGIVIDDRQFIDSLFDGACSR